VADCSESRPELLEEAERVRPLARQQVPEQMSIIVPTRIAGKFLVGRKIGAGSFGDVHIGTNAKTGREVAIKMESVKVKQPQLLYEAKLYKMIAGCYGVPEVHWYGVEGDTNVMVIDLLGPSLEDLFNFCDRKFSLKTLLLVSEQMLSVIEAVHANNFIHRDIKPENFLMGAGRTEKQLFIIDFGLARKYRDPNSQEHIAYRDGKQLTGTARYTSINTHVGIEQSRRDDLEAIAYVLFYFGRGSLPWQGLKGDPKDKHKLIQEKKESVPPEVLGKNLPSEFTTYLKYTRNLNFEDRPNYAFPRMLLQQLFVRKGFEKDMMYDWDIQDAREREQHEARFGTPCDVDLATKLRAA